MQKNTTYIDKTTAAVSILNKKENFKKHLKLLNNSVVFCIKEVVNSFCEVKVDKESRTRTKRTNHEDDVIDAHATYMKFKEDIDVEAKMTYQLQAMGWHEK